MAFASFGKHCVYRSSEGGWLHVLFEMHAVTSLEMIASLRGLLHSVKKTSPSFFSEKEWKSLFLMVSNLEARGKQEGIHSPWIFSIKLMNGLKRLVICEWTTPSIIRAVLTSPLRCILASLAALLVGWCGYARTGILELLYPERLLFTGGEHVLDMNDSFAVCQGVSCTSLDVHFSLVKIL